MKKEARNVKEYRLRLVTSEPNESILEKVKIEDSTDAAKFARKFYFDDISIFESMFIILLNQANITIGWSKISQGGVSQTVADVRIITKYALDSMASGVILVHNHPSGNPKSGAIDDKTTKHIKEALNLFDVRLLDHIILTEDEYFSYSDNGNII